MKGGGCGRGGNDIVVSNLEKAGPFCWTRSYLEAMVSTFLASLAHRAQITSKHARRNYAGIVSIVSVGEASNLPPVTLHKTIISFSVWPASLRSRIVGRRNVRFQGISSR
jgi:hypothetical protein